MILQIFDIVANKIKKLLFSPWGLYLVVSLTFIGYLTTLWLPAKSVIAGHDSGLALNTGQFLLTRLSQWDDHINFGQDNSQHLGSITIHFLDHVSALVAGVNYAGNRVALFFWLSLLFLSAYLFAWELRSKLGKYFPILFPLFFVVNFYTLQSIFILERAKYGLIVALFALLYLAERIREKRNSPFTASVIMSIAFFVFNGGSWLGMPLYGGVAAVSLILFFYTFYLDFRIKNFAKTRGLASFLGLTLIGYILVNSYSLAPYLKTFLSGDYSQLTDTTIIRGNKGWLDYISQRTSPINILRMQGIPEWYASNNFASELHSYSAVYLNNRALVLFSFLIPVVAFASLLVAKTQEQKRLIGLFSLIVLFGVFFSAGTHAPLGTIYGLLYENIPGFSIFRSPIYKFGVMPTLGLTVLLAFTLSFLIEKGANAIKANNYRRLPHTGFIFCGLGIIIWFLYYNVIFTPEKIFTWRTPNYSTRVKLPEYLSSLDNFDNNNKRILIVPAFNKEWRNDNYSWGYWSLSTLFSVNSGLPIVSDDISLTENERSLVRNLYKAVEEGNSTVISKLANKLHIGYILLRKDTLDSNLWSGPANPDIYEKTLNDPSVFEKEFEEGPWQIFKVKNFVNQKISLATQLSRFTDVDAVANLSSEDENFILASKQKNDAESLITREVKSFTCESCLLEIGAPYAQLPIVNILPNSPLYFFKERRQSELFKKVNSAVEEKDALIGTVFVKVSELNTILSLKEDEKFAVKILDEINNHLDRIYFLLGKEGKNAQNFFQAKQIWSLANTVRANMQVHTNLADNPLVDETIRNKMLEIIKKSDTLENMHKDLTEARETWEYEKVYKPEFPTGRQSELIIDRESLPINAGNSTLPLTVTIDTSTSRYNLEPTFSNDRLSYLVPPLEDSTATLTLKFPEGENVYKPGILNLPSAENCTIGTIDQVGGNKHYIVKIKAPEDIVFFIKQSFKSDLKQKDSLYNDSKIKVEANQTYRFYYSPYGGTERATLYMCGLNKVKPGVGVKVVQIYAPTIYISSGQVSNNFDKAKVEYTKLTSSKYRVTVRNSEEPALLIFKERFSPLWNIYKQEPIPNGSLKEASYKHIPVDGYANAWLISDRDAQFIISYGSDRLLYFGMTVSSASILVLLTYLFFKMKSTFLAKKGRKTHER